MRERLPDRRPSWVQSVKIDGQRFYLTVGEYEDGRPAEIFIDAYKYGTFARGNLDALARMTSLALQCQTPLPDVINSLKGLNYPPNGIVSGSPFISGATSVTDWIARELEYAYITAPQEQIPDKVAGHKSEEWRTGA